MDFLVMQCKEDGEVALDEGTEVRNFGNWMRKKKGKIEKR